MKYPSYCKVILVLASITLLLSCQNNSKDPGPPMYKLSILPLTALTSDMSTKTNVAHVDNKLSILTEYNFNSNQFKLIDLYNDNLLKTIPVPFPIKNMGSISVYDSSSFAFLTDTTFYVYANNKIIKYDHTLFKDNDYIPLNYVNIIYKPELNIIIAAVLTYNKKDKNEKTYSTNFLMVYNLKDTTNTLLPFPYPDKFQGGVLGIPKAYLSNYNENLLVSFSLDDNIYKINLLTKKVETILLNSKFSTIADASYPKNGTRQEKADAIERNANHVGAYGMAFYNDSTKQFYRMYRPALPNQDKDGNYYSSKERGMYVIRENEDNKMKEEYNLPNGVYFVPSDWSFNKYNNTLTYTSILKTAKDENTWYYYLHTLLFYNN